MVAMTQSPSSTRLGLAYNAFLFASIEDDGARAPLSTVSALARLDVDPWQEAAELTRLPKDSAIQRLAAQLAQLPGRPLSDSETIAIRLVALLPGQGGADGAVATRPDNPGAGFNDIFVAISFLIAIVVLFGGFFEAGGDHSPAQAAAKRAVAVSARTP